MTLDATLSENRVAVTGIGVVAPGGTGIDRFWESLRNDEPELPPTPPSPFDAPVPERAFTLAASGFDVEAFVDRRIVRRLSNFSSMSLIAARLAMKNSGQAAPPLSDRAGVVLGTAFGSGTYHFEYYDGLFEEGLKEASPLLFSESVLNAATGHITQQLGLRGPGLTLVGGEDVGLQALATAFDQVRIGDVPVAIAGGSDEYCDLLHAALGKLGFVGGGLGRPLAEPGRLCPYGEGSGVVLLESVDDARARGAPVLARITGAGRGRAARGEESANAVARAICTALRDAATEPGDLGLVVSGADGGRLDTVEIQGLSLVLNPEEPFLLCAPKRWTGESFGFSSAAQAIVAIMALATGEVPVTLQEGNTILPPAWSSKTETKSFSDRPALVVSATRSRGATAIVIEPA